MKYRIAFFSPCEFGQVGTPGTYRIIEEVSKHHEVRVFSPPPSKRNVYWERSIPLIPIKDLNEKSLTVALPFLYQFSPDIIYIFNARAWHESLIEIKKILPNAKVVLDIKTPLLASDSIMRKNIQESGLDAADLVDLIVSPSASSVDTWLPGYGGKSYIFPLGLDLSAFSSPSVRMVTKQDHSNKPLHLIYASTLHPLRKGSLLIQGFIESQSRNPGRAVLHIYGDGPDKTRLEKLVNDSGFFDCIRFHGLVPQKELFCEMQKMDGAIGWVPKSVYNDSPSLKVLEYLAAGLPVLATATKAHCELENEGFILDFCDDTPMSLASGLNRLIEIGSDSHCIEKNLIAVKSHDYSLLVKDRLLPLLDRLIEPEVVNYDFDRKDHISTAVTDKRDKLPVQALRIMLILNTIAHGKGGAERVVTDLAKFLASQGHRIYLAYENRGMPAYEVDSRVVLVPYDNFSGLESVVSGACIDVMTVFYFNDRNLVPFARLAYLHKIPLVVQECTNPDRLRFNNWCSGGISRARACWEREVVTSSAARIRLVMPGYVTSFSDFQRPMVRGFPNSAKITDIRAQPGSPYSDRYTILIINGFKKNKNLKDLVSAFCRISMDFPDWDLRIVGKEPNWNLPHLQYIYEEICDKEMWARINIVGPTDDIQQELSKSHIHVIASLSEGCPTVVLEAMAVGLPSIGFADCPGTNELIRHEQNGLLVDSVERVSGLADSLERLITNSEEREKFGKQALIDTEILKPDEIYNRWEALLKEASKYKADPKKLQREQKNIDYERSGHAKRMLKKFLDN